MKDSGFFRKLTVTIIFIVAAAAVAAVVFLLAAKTKADAPELFAKTMLIKVYGATAADFEKLNGTVAESQGNDKNLIEYVRSLYGDRLTDNGYDALMANRIPSRAAKIAYEKNADIKVFSVSLKPAAALEGSKRYDYVVQAQTGNSDAEAFTFKGIITLMQKDGKWKVDGIS